VETFGVLVLRDAVERLRRVGQPARVLEEKGRQEAQAVIPLALLEGGPLDDAARAFRRGRAGGPVGAGLVLRLRRDRQRVGGGGGEGMGGGSNPRLRPIVCVVKLLELLGRGPLRLLLGSLPAAATALPAAPPLRERRCGSEEGKDSDRKKQ